jgi:hypothetical protein
VVQEKISRGKHQLWTRYDLPSFKLGVRANGVGKEGSSDRRYQTSFEDLRKCARQLSL